MRLTIVGMILAAGCAWGGITVGTNDIWNLKKGSNVVTSVTLTGVMESSEWVSWLSTNQYVKVESDPTVAGAIETHGTNATAHASQFASKWSNPTYSTNLTWTSDGKEITIVGHYGYTTDIVIPEVLDGLPVTKIGSLAFKLSNITSIYAPSIISVGIQAFSDNPMTSNFLPSMTVIGDGAFSYTDITSVDMPLLKTVGVEAFSGCSSLASVSLPSATSIGYRAFFDCDSLITVHLPVAVYLGETAFFGCANLTTVKLPQLEAFNDGALAVCPKLNAVYFDADVPPTVGVDLYSGSTIVTNYIKRTTAVWPETFGGRPVVRMPLEGTVIKIGAVTLGGVERTTWPESGTSAPVAWTPIATVASASVATSTWTTASAIDVFTTSEAMALTNNFSQIALNCGTNYERKIIIYVTGTNGCNTTFLGNYAWHNQPPEFTCTGRYEFVFSTSCGTVIQARQTYPTIFRWMSHPKSATVSSTTATYGGSYLLFANNITNAFFFSPHFNETKSCIYKLSFSTTSTLANTNACRITWQSNTYPPGMSTIGSEPAGSIMTGDGAQKYTVYTIVPSIVPVAQSVGAHLRFDITRDKVLGSGVILIAQPYARHLTENEMAVGTNRTAWASAYQF